MLTHSQKHIDSHRAAIIRERSRQAQEFFSAVTAEMVSRGVAYSDAVAEVAAIWPVELDWQPI